MVKRIIIGLLITSLILFFATQVSAQADTLPEGYEDAEDGIPEDIAEILPDGLFSDNADDIMQAVTEMTSWDFFIDYLFDLIGLNFKKVISTFGTISALLCLCSLLSMLKKCINNETLDGALSLIGGTIIIASLIDISKVPLQRALLLFEEIKIMVNTLSPLICSMYAMGGNVTSAIVHNYGFIVFLSILENICILSLQSIIGICIVLNIASVFLKDNSLFFLSNTIKRAFTFFIGFIMLIFTTVISTQTLLATKADSLSSKTAKMLATHFIPLVGGAVGDSLKTAGASIEYLRTSVGIAFIVILILMILPTLISMILYKSVFTINNAIAGLLGCEREGKIIMEMSSIYGYVIAIISICSIILLLLLTTFAKCSSVLNV